MRVLIAFDKWKDALRAEEACAATKAALAEVQPDWRADLAPLSDGGEGFCEVLTHAAGGELREVTVTGPRGQPSKARYGIVDTVRLPEAARERLAIAGAGRLGIIEMAQASGLQMLAREARDVWQTTTRGTGELMSAAVESGAAAILLGIGGSATSDCGLGALEALGLTFHTETGGGVSPPVPAAFHAITGIKGTAGLNVPVRVACDVSNPLLGERGAAAVYGPQKGLAKCEVRKLDAAMGRVGKLLCAHFGVDAGAMDEPSSGAAGGIGFGLRVACGARYVPGFDLVWEWLRLEPKLQAADVLITGEGKFDASSLQGKGPGTLIEAARHEGKRVVVFAGRVDDALKGGEGVVEVSPRELPLEVALRRADELLRTAVKDYFARGWTVSCRQ